MPTESTFLLAGLFLLLAAAGWAMGRFGERDDEDAPPPLNIDYLKGLNFLLNEQTIFSWMKRVANSELLPSSMNSAC